MDEVLCIIEIPKGSRNKYEWDEERGLLLFDRFLSSSTVFPTDYGFVPESIGPDGEDPLGVPVLAVASCGGGSRAGPVQKTPSPKARLAFGRPDHIALVVLENAEYSEVIGSHAAPFINGLARRYGLATQMYAISHPSLPNYLALTGGSTHGIGSDCTDCSVPGTGVAGQLD